MGTDGTEWDTNDVFDPKRLNQKSFFIGKDTQVSLISSPQPGQMCYIKNTTGIYKSDKIITRNSTNTSWLYPVMSESNELSLSAPFGGIAISNIITRLYSFFTMPSTHDFYEITALQIKQQGAGTNIKMRMGVDLVDANPPTNDSVVTLCITEVFTIVGGSGITYKKNTSPNTVRGGAIIGAWVLLDGASGTTGVQGTTVPQSKRGKNYSIFPTSIQKSDNVPFSFFTIAPSITVFYRGYS